MFTRRRRLALAAAAAASALLVLSACSESGSSSDLAGNTTTHSNETWYKNMESMVTAGYEGIDIDPPEAGPIAEAAKSVWYISFAESCTGCALAGSGFKEAANAIGWDLTYVDGKGDPGTIGSAIKQAVAANADGIGLFGIDCSAIKNPLEEAKAAGIPVVTTFGVDCDPPLFIQTTLAGSPSSEGLRDWTAMKTAWAITKTGGNTKAITVDITDVQGVAYSAEGFHQMMDECDSCETVASIDVTFAQTANIQALLSAELAKHPDANVVHLPVGGLLPQGARAAIEQSGRRGDLTVIGAACDGGEIDLMRDGWNIVCSGYQQEQHSWMAVDYLNRIFAGQAVDQLPTAGVGYQLVDSGHNLPAEGEEWKIPTDYAAAYASAWKG